MSIPTRGLTGTDLSIAKAARRLMGLRENTVNSHGKENPVNTTDALKALREDASISHDITRERLATAEARLVQADKLLAMKEELYALRLAERDATIAGLTAQVAELQEFLAVVRP